MQKLGVSDGEAKAHGSGAVVGDDAVREVAAPRISSATTTADDSGEVASAGRADAKKTFDRTAKVGGSERPAVRVADSRPQPERVHPPSVRRRGHGERKIGNKVQAVRPSRMLEGHQRVVGEPEELRRRVVRLIERGIDRGPKSEQG